GLDEVADQMAGGVHAAIELPALLIHPNLCHAGVHGSINEMDDPVRILYHPQNLALADPASIKGLSASLRMKQRGPEYHGEFIFLGCAVQDLYIGFEVITMEKEAKRHVPCPSVFC